MQRKWLLLVQSAIICEAVSCRELADDGSQPGRGPLMVVTGKGPPQMQLPCTGVHQTAVCAYAC